MALDGIFLNRLAHEIREVAIGARVDKIAQPSREELVMTLRWRGGGGKLLMSASPQAPRIHFTGDAPENPAKPPMFCMLLRKHLSGAKLAEVRQIQLDRILHLDFETQNELGDQVTVTLAMEIMGRHSNLVVIGAEGRIIDAIRRVDLETSSIRQILPGMRYALPPAQNKLSLFEAEPAQVLERMDAGKDLELSKALMDVLQGMSPILCREIAHYATRGVDASFKALTDGQRQRLEFYLTQLTATVREYKSTPTMVLEPSGKPKDFSFVPIHQYGAAMLTREYESCSGLLDSFYTHRDRMERVRQRSGDLLKLLANTSDRLTRKLAAQKEELLQCAKRDGLREKGDLISANLYTLQKGDAKATVLNFYSPGEEYVDIELDPMLTPAQNAQRYYALYRKADTAEKMLVKLVSQGEAELVYIDSVFDALTRASGESELDAIRSELAAGGYVRAHAKKGGKREDKLAPMRYLSADGFTILSGRNNLQNDRLTLREARATDLWLHTQRIPGSHTIILAEGREVPKTTIEQACVIAAYNSKARDSGKVPVDFTPIRNVKKPGGAKPGMVIYDHYQTVIVDPDEALVRSLQQK